MLLTIVMLAWPTVLENLLQTIVQYIDSAMVGRIGAEATAVVGMSTSVTWLVNSPILAIGVGFMAYISQAVGAGKHENIRKASVQAILVSLLLGVVIGALTLGVSPFLPSLMGLDGSLHRDATLYFAIICAPMIFRSATMVLGAVLRAVGQTKIPMYVNITMNVINVIMNFIFIYPSREVTILGNTFRIWGAGYGAVGAGIGTAIAYVCGGTLMLFALYRNETLSPKGMRLRVDGEVLKPCIKIGIPVALEHVATSMGHVVFASMVTRLGTVAFAAHSIALTAEQAFYIPGYGMQAAAATLAGNALGSKDEKRLKDLTSTFVVLIAIIMAVSGALLFAFAPFVMGIFTMDEKVIELGSHILRMVAISEPVFGIAVILQGLFSGVGDTMVPFFFALFSMWGVRILGTFICVEVLHMGLFAVWGCMIANNVCMGLLLTLRYRTGKWNPMKRTPEKV